MPIDRSQLTPAALEDWPAAATASLSPEHRDIFRQRQRAIELLANGKPIADIERRTRVGRKQLYNLVRRALKTHPDGRVFGYRALLPSLRVKRHERTAPMQHRPQHTAGDSGAMSQLLARYPELVTFLEGEITKQPLLFAGGPDGRLQVRGLHAIHGRFIERCRELGLRESDYPLVKDQKGIRALSSALKRLGSETFRQAAKAAGAAHAKGRWHDTAKYLPPAITRPYQAVEFDGHKLDLRLSITFQDPFGFDQTLKLTRVWILAIIDVFSRAILGYELVLAPEYSRYDVIRAIQKAIEPHADYPFSIPGLDYGRDGGFPSQRLPELAYAVWEEFRFDNAKANLATDTLMVLRDELSCIAHAGPAAEPDQRAIVERLFKTLTTTMSQRLPATTRGNPEELRRLLNARGSSFVITMPLHELEQLIEAVLGCLNGLPHSSLGGRTPLQALEHSIRGKHDAVRYLPAPMRRNLCLLQMAHTSRVSGNIAKGIRPTISFFGVRYSSAAFSERSDLISRRVLVYYNPDNVCTIRVFAIDGSEIGILTAARPWHNVTHSLRMRQHIAKLIRDGKIRVPASANPVEVYLKYIQKAAPKSRRLASELEGHGVARRHHRSRHKTRLARTMPQASRSRPSRRRPPRNPSPPSNPSSRDGC